MYEDVCWSQTNSPGISVFHQGFPFPVRWEIIELSICGGLQYETEIVPIEKGAPSIRTDNPSVLGGFYQNLVAMCDRRNRKCQLRGSLLKEILGEGTVVYMLLEKVLLQILHVQHVLDGSVVLHDSVVIEIVPMLLKIVVNRLHVLVMVIVDDLL